MKFRVAKENLSGILESEYYEFDNKTQSFTPTKESPELEDLVFYKLYSESINKEIKEKEEDVTGLSKIIERLNIITDSLEDSVDRLDSITDKLEDDDDYEDEDNDEDEYYDDDEEEDNYEEDDYDDEDINEYIFMPQIKIIGYK